LNRSPTTVVHNLVPDSTAASTGEEAPFSFAHAEGTQSGQDDPRILRLQPFILVHVGVPALSVGAGDSVCVGFAMIFSSSSLYHNQVMRKKSPKPCCQIDRSRFHSTF